MNPEHMARMVAKLSHDDYVLACDILKSHAAAADARHEQGGLWNPDIVLAPDGEPYLYRWLLVPRNERSRALTMFHIQVASDPTGPFHDHPWDNFSVILSGGYNECLQSLPPDGEVVLHKRRQGDTVVRAATEAHRLILPPGTPYTMTLFSTGPKLRDWGFWYGDQWRSHKQCVEVSEGVSIHVNREEQL